MMRFGWNLFGSVTAAVLFLAVCWVGCEGKVKLGRADGSVPDSAVVDNDGAAADAALVNDAAPGVDAAPSIDAAPPMDAAPPVDAGIVCPPTGPLDCVAVWPGSYQCFSGTSCYVSDVQSAINRVINQNPSWFDLNHPLGCPMILVPTTDFVTAVAQDISSHGLCAVEDPNAPQEEVVVKHDNAFSENFDIVASTGCARRSAGIYTSYCVPSWW